jgi:glycosyltransferase involved in cell wall biosynthesis
MNHTAMAEQGQETGEAGTPLSGKRIAFIGFDYPLGASTMLINSIALLARTNQVDVFVSKAELRELPFDGWMERHLVAYPSFSRALPVRAIKLMLRMLPGWLERRAARLWWALGNIDLLLFSRWLGKRLRERKYDILVPVECFSLIAVDRIAPADVDVIYYNLELLDWGTGNPMYIAQEVLKEKEHRALRGVAHVMITSPQRAKLFASINRYPEERISALPVAPLKRRHAERSRYFRDKFDIADDRLVLIYAGNFAPWAQCLEIIASMDNWPPNAVLVMHTWRDARLSRGYFRRMSRAAAGRPVYFSDQNLPYAALAPALSSADIGLLFYEAIDANFTEILFSSNKMAEYMSAGLPVICSPLPSLETFVREENIGVATGFDGIGPAAARIAAAMDSYRASVANCRERHFEFEPHFSRAYSAYARSAAGSAVGRAGL